MGMNRNVSTALLLLVLAATSPASARPVKLAASPVLTPDGATLVFEWGEDLWSVPATGGVARALTRHPAVDRMPSLSPDGTRVAFMSNRDGTSQVYVMPLAGGEPKQVTFHSEGAAPQDWHPDGVHLLVRGSRDSGEFLPQRFLTVDTRERLAEQLVFDDAGDHGRWSPDGTKLLFVRDGSELYRRNYRGSKAATIWLHDPKDGTFEKVAAAEGDCRSPLWRPDGKGFYFVNDADGCMNLWEKEIKGRPKQRTFFKDFPVILPNLARNGSNIVFRQGFDFYRWQPGTETAPVVIPIEAPDDDTAAPTKRIMLQRAENYVGSGTTAFTEDGKQIAFSSGGRLWIMDTQFKEPVPITQDKAFYDASPVFAPDTQTLYFIRNSGDRANVWSVKRTDERLPWWQNRSFALKAVTDDDLARASLSIDPTGKRLAWTVRPGELWVANADGTGGRQLIASAGEVGYDWAPDGRWLVCSVQASDDNRDVWIHSVDGARAPYNVSRHPNWDGSAAWSPDGRAIAYIGRTYDNNVDVYYAWLRLKDHGRLEKEIKRADATPAEKKESKEHAKEEKPPETKPAADTKPAATNAASPEVAIDFEGLAERVQRVREAGTGLGNLFWSGDSKAIAYHGTVGGKTGTWKLFMPNPGKPDFMCAAQGTEAWWTKKLDVLWVVDGLPATVEVKHAFTAHMERDLTAWRTLGFRIMWRILRDEFYDAALNNVDWEAALARYEPLIPVVDEAGYARLAMMLIGELNASHMDFTQTQRARVTGDWTPVTGHPGVRFDGTFAGPGLRVGEVLPGSPADRDITRLAPGDIVLSMDGQAVGPAFDLTRVLNGPLPREVLLVVTNQAGQREFRLPLTAPDRAREFARDAVEKTARKRVAEWSGGRLGYVDIEKMQIEDLREFEKKVFAEGEGHDGLVIDVRNNTGGYISDRLLNILCHPRHAITIPRGGTASYQGSYIDHAFWMKPIIVLCNQYTASNGEIFSQAIKTLKRGKVVGTETQAAVISTGQRHILDLGEFRVPHRAWFNLETGVDMEFEGVKPDVAVPDLPGDRMAGRDEPLKKAVSILVDDIKRQPAPVKPKYASELRKK